VVPKSPHVILDLLGQRLRAATAVVFDGDGDFDRCPLASSKSKSRVSSVEFERARLGVSCIRKTASMRA
jgi:hypothetical protein